ncbi:MAG: hypothetical protein K6B65_04520 [Bacilli bacterium]|nr:hypothetical protein [Bacilli bacterium]
MKENHDDIALDTLSRLSAISEDVAKISEVEDGFESRLEELRGDVDRLFALQNTIERELEKWSGLLDRVQDALTAMNGLTEKVERLEQTLSEMDLNEVRSSADKAVTSIDKAVSVLGEEKDKPKTLAEAKGKKKR